MIDVIFDVPAINFFTPKVPMPEVPRKGDQIYLNDFISDEDQELIMEKKSGINIDSLFVTHITWYRDDDQKAYAILTLEL